MKSSDKMQTQGRKYLIITVLLAVILLGVTALVATRQGSAPGLPDTDKPALSDAERFAAEYSDVDEVNPFIYASGQQVLSILDDGTGLIFLGFPECPWCQSLAGLVAEAADSEQLDRVYYLNIREERSSDSEIYQNLVTRLEEYLSTDDNGEPVIYVPDITAVKNGEIVGRYKMEQATDEERSGGQASYWTEGRKQRAVDSLRDMIRKLR